MPSPASSETQMTEPTRRSPKRIDAAGSTARPR